MSFAVKVEAPKVAIGASAGAGIGGNASVNIGAPNLKVEAPKISAGLGVGGASVNATAPKISMPSMTM